MTGHAARDDVLSPSLCLHRPGDLFVFTDVTTEDSVMVPYRFDDEMMKIVSFD